MAGRPQRHGWTVKELLPPEDKFRNADPRLSEYKYEYFKKMAQAARGGPTPHHLDAREG